MELALSIINNLTSLVNIIALTLTNGLYNFFMEEVTPVFNREEKSILPKIIGIIFFIILTVLLIGGLYFLFFRKSPVVIRGGESVITQLRTLNRFETSAYSIEKIIEAGDEGNRFEQVLFGDRILLVANGEVIAGFDLSTLSDKDISIEGTTARITLPAPQILVSRLNNEKTRVYDRQQGFLTQGDKDLESTARSEAERSIRLAACEGGILRSAATNGQNQLSALVKALGYTTVIVSIPEGKC